MVVLAMKRKLEFPDRAELATGLTQKPAEPAEEYEERLARAYALHLAYEIAGERGLDLLEALSRAGRIK